MSNESNRDMGKVIQFRNLSESDKGLVQRLVRDRTAPRPEALRGTDIAPIRNVFQRTLRDTSDVRNIFQTMPDLHLPREILVSAICAPGDLTKTTLRFENELPGVDSAIINQLNLRMEQFHFKERKMEIKVAEWVDDALIWSGAHPILILPEAALDRMILGRNEDLSMESVASYAGEWSHGWFKPKGIFGLRLPTAGGENYASFESSRNRITMDNMVEYHTIKADTVVGGARKSIKLPIRVTDNLAALRTPAVQHIKRQNSREMAYGVPALESRIRSRRGKVNEEKAQQGDGSSGPSSAEIYSNYFQSPKQTSRSRLVVVPNLRQAGGETEGHPLEYHLASEAVFPVCVPGDESNHVGYLVLLGQNGFPVSFTRRLSFYDDIRRGAAGPNSGSSTQTSGEVLQIAKEVMNGNIANASDYEIDRLAEIYGQFIDADIIARLKSGVNGGDFELGRTDHINRLMLARAMKNQVTTLLYVPADMMIYMAYEYNEYGVGKSILEDAKALAAMRASVTVANVIGSTRNAIPGKDINIKLDPDDGDPLGTVTYQVNEAVGLAYHAFPMNISSTAGLAEQLQMGAFSVTVEGNPRFPDMATTITPRESQQVVIDPDLQKQLRDDLTRVFSLTPEAVDGVNQADFATTVLQNNHMLMKRVLLIQGKTNPFLTDYVRTWTSNSGILIDELLEIITQNVKYLPDEFKEEPEKFLKEYLDTLHVKLPEPETDNLSKQLEIMKKFSDSLDDVLPHYIRDEFFDGYSSEYIQQAMPSVVAAWKGLIMRNWMRKRGILRELDVFTSAEDGSPVMDLAEEMGNHVDAVTKSVAEYAKKVAKDAVSRKRKLTALAKAIGEAKSLEEIFNAMGEPAEVPSDEPAADDVSGDVPLEEGGGTDLDDMNLSDEDTPAADDTQEEEEDQTQDEPTGDEPPASGDDLDDLNLTPET